ncbi:MAG: type II toxin-antitoxin system HipA family toxin [Bacteroidota bacterium]
MMNSKLEQISVYLFGNEVGRVAWDGDRQRTFFQYHPDFLANTKLDKAFPYIFRNTDSVQVFKDYHNSTFKGLPPPIADSLPDDFGNTIFNNWLKSQNKSLMDLSPIQQLAYVSNRGMGALEFKPPANLPESRTIELNEMVKLVDAVMNNKKTAQQDGLNEISLLNIFRIGTSAGGARPKLIVSENRQTGKLVPGDLYSGNDYSHYLVKLHLDASDKDYNRSKVEFAYYKLALKAGLEMTPSKLIDDTHFATERFDRDENGKVHMLTSTGLTGWDFRKADDSSYENLFRLSYDLGLPQQDLEALFRRMVFNVMFANTDDHLKNHSFIYKKDENQWRLSPSYDLTYPLNAMAKWPNPSRGLSINGKRKNITKEDLLKVAEMFSIKRPQKILNQVEAAGASWNRIAKNVGVPEPVATSIQDDFKFFNGRQLNQGLKR